MAGVQAHPASESPIGMSDKAALLTRLDDLLEQYLNTLDQYQKTQQQLTANLASGFFSLAQANFNSPSRTRYGQDYYDERVQALRTITLTVEEPKVAFAISALEPPAPREQLGSTIQASAESFPASPTHLPAESATLEAAPQAVNNTSTTSASGIKERADPLRWFGILVPPALRSAQASFVSAVKGQVPQLATLTKDLGRQEVDIARLRKQIRKM